ncbi:metallophosphoesterase [bacterium]|nr:metallophosphoesterase [bacterium]
MLSAALILALAIFGLLLFIGRISSRLTERISDRYLSLDIPSGILCVLAVCLYFYIMFYRRDLFDEPVFIWILIGIAVLTLLEPCIRHSKILQNRIDAAKILRTLEPRKLGRVICQHYEIGIGEEPTRIVHLSDLHYNQLSREFLLGVVKEVNQLEPDYILVTGDFLQKVGEVGELKDLLEGLRAKNTVFYVLGNHDFWIGGEEVICEALDGLGWVRLNGRFVETEKVLFFGTERPWGKEENLALPKSEKLKIALAHDPDEWENTAALGADVTLSGHTHGGQVRFGLFGPMILPSQKGAMRAERVLCKEGHILLISRGLGKPYFRICNPTEISLLDIRR